MTYNWLMKEVIKMIDYPSHEKFSHSLPLCISVFLQVVFLIIFVLPAMLMFFMCDVFNFDLPTMSNVL